MDPAGWGWTADGHSDITDNPEAARNAAETHARPGTTVTVEFLLHHGPNPGLVHTGSGWRGTVTGDGTAEWTPVSNIRDDVVKPVWADLGLDLDALKWTPTAAGALEYATPDSPDGAQVTWEPGYWILLRSPDGTGPVLVYDRNEWDAFQDGVIKGEFTAAETAGALS